MEALHSQQASLCLLGVLLGGLGSGEGLAVQGTETGLGAQKAWHEEVKEGPELQHVVLDGGTSQDEAVLRCQCLACLHALSLSQACLRMNAGSALGPRVLILLQPLFCLCTVAFAWH